MANEEMPKAPRSPRKAKSAKAARRTQRVGVRRVSVRLLPKWAEWLGGFALSESFESAREVEYGEVVERALALLKKETGFEMIRPGRGRSAAVETTAGDEPRSPIDPGVAAGDPRIVPADAESGEQAA